MKERFKNWTTTSIGILIVLAGLFMLGMKIWCWVKHENWCDFTVREILIVFGFGYTYIAAKDTLLEGITMGLLKKKS